jgi:hypothetical protein
VTTIQVKEDRQMRLRKQDLVPLYFAEPDDRDLYVAGRHDDQLLGARVIPEDPYTTWLDQRERERRERAAAGARLPYEVGNG